MYRFSSYSTLLILASALATTIGASSAAAQPISRYSQDFDGPAFDAADDMQRKAILEAEGWSFDQNDPAGERFDSTNGDRYLGIGGVTDDDVANDSDIQKQASYAITADSTGLTSGAVDITAGAYQGDNADFFVRFLDGGPNGTELFNAEFRLPTGLFVKTEPARAAGPDVDRFTKGLLPGLDIQVDGTGGDYANRVAAHVEWNVNNNGTDGDFNYSLTQPALDEQTIGRLDTDLVTGPRFSNNGVPDTILFESTDGRGGVNRGVLFDLSVVPEPSSLIVFGLGSLVVLGSRRRQRK